jgi:glucose-6-phosphate-specific signal transduction histidine kinase
MEKVMVIRQEGIDKIATCFSNQDERDIFRDCLRAIGQDIFAMTRYSVLLGEENVKNIDLKQAASMLMFIRQNYDTVMDMLKITNFEYLDEEEVKKMIESSSEDHPYLENGSSG